MADQNMNITSPVKVESDSKQRVAFDLAVKITYYSGLNDSQKDKKYWLTLYRQCLKATGGSPLEVVLRED